MKNIKDNKSSFEMKYTLGWWTLNGLLLLRGRLRLGWLLLVCFFLEGGWLDEGLVDEGYLDGERVCPFCEESWVDEVVAWVCSSFLGLPTFLFCQVSSFFLSSSLPLLMSSTPLSLWLLELWPYWSHLLHLRLLLPVYCFLTSLTSLLLSLYSLPLLISTDGGLTLDNLSLSRRRGP